MEKHRCRACGSEVSVLHKTQCNSNMKWSESEIGLCDLCYTTSIGSSLLYRPIGTEAFERHELWRAMIQIGNNIRELILAQRSDNGPTGT